MKNYMIRISHQILLGDKIENNEMGGTCGTYWRKERHIQGFD
jgi:hypothetical protein